MLGDHPLDVVLLAKDLKAARDFYADKIGLEITLDVEEAVEFKTGGEGRLAVTASTVGTKDEQTQASFRVPDVAAEVAELRSRGVKIEDYDTPELKTEDGIADLGFALAAWFIDPGGNAIGIMQWK
jgi:catechol 2,3-dioxygenase-like lactoylglutathione lyase family enzyme